MNTIKTRTSFLQLVFVLLLTTDSLDSLIMKESISKLDQGASEFQKELNAKTTSYLDILSEARKATEQRRYDARRNISGFVIKLGELSFIIGAAITPILLGRALELKHPRWLFTAMFIYFLIGSISIWRTKLESERSFEAYRASSIYEFECDIQKIINETNKLKLFPGDRNFQKALIDSEQDFLRKTLSFSDLPKFRIDFTLDILVAYLFQHHICY